MNDKGMSPSSTGGFWSTMSRLYERRDLIRDSSNKIVDLAAKLRDCISPASDIAAWNNDELDLSQIRKILVEIKKEINSILSYSTEITLHLDNPTAVPALSGMAQLLVGEMHYPGNILYLKLKQIVFGCDMFSQAANKLVLNPTKKSLKVAFGIEVGIENARLKALLESNKSNF